MPQSQSGARRRLAAAGLTTGAVVAAVLVAPTAAYAAPSTTPPVGPPSGTVTVTDTGAFSSATTVGVELRADSCSSTYATPSTTILAGTSPTKADANTVTFGVPTTLAAGTNGAAKTYNVCIYNGATAGTSTQITGSGTPTYTVSVASTVSPTTGASGGGNTITITAPTASAYFTNITAPAAVFSTSACPTAYGSPTTGTAATVTKTSNTVGTVTVPSTVLGNGTTANPYNVCIYAGNSSSSALLAATTYGATLPTVTPSATIGSSVGGNGIVVTGSTNFLTGATSAGVAFTTASTCPTTYPSASTYNAGTSTPGVIQATGPRILGTNKLAVTVPGLPLSTGTPSVYQMCIYNGTSAGSSTILAAAAYNSTTVPAPTTITPNAGPAFGGTPITVTGSNFPTTAGSITATLGGAALTGITPVSPTAFTAITPSHSVASGAALVVSTQAGSATLQNSFTFANAIKTDPNTASAMSGTVNLDITGSGFYQLSGSAAIYLVNGAYDSDPHPENATYYTNGPVAECGSILVISDNELVCTLALSARLDETGSAIDPVNYSNSVTDIATTQNSNVITSAGGKFSAGDVGHPISETGNSHIPTSTTVTAVLSPSRAVISKDATATTTSAITGAIGGPTRAVTGAGTTTGGSTVTAALGSFSVADIGRPITGSGAGIQSGTTIIGVNASGTTATLSQAIGTGATGQSVSVFPSALVPDGAYTLTVVSDGALSAAATSPSSYTQTVVSSGATFTVAPF